MSNIATRKPSVKLVGGHATTTSLKVAESFGKRHDLVLRTIRSLECSEEFRLRNFAESSYTSAQNKALPMYTITRDGFAFLASGFTGKEAAQWKERYIEAFNKLEQHALEKAANKRAPKALPPAKKSLSALPGVKYHYPRSLLEQPYYTNPGTGKVTITLAMLGNTTHFVSPLMALLNRLRADGHEITAPFDEAVAMRTALIQANDDIDAISTLAIKAQFHRRAE